MYDLHGQFKTSISILANTYIRRLLDRIRYEVMYSLKKGGNLNDN